ncbi:acetyl-CoA carboxylase carboxyltransferase subunit alpha [bacterium]|nr:acetyl-CoA carboxylase carboxyltransferase subunit alpha [bacterium]
MSVWEKIEELEKQIDKFKSLSVEEHIEVDEVIVILKEKINDLHKNLTSWDRTRMARHIDRPKFLDYVPKLFNYFQEIGGDRKFKNDNAIICGLASLDKRKVVVIGQEKGKDTSDKIYRNFGMSHPEGYWKTIRVMKLAEKFGLPLLLFVDTPGAYPGIGAEERGQLVAIAENLYELSGIRIPIIVTILGEGGSGGALALGVGDRLLMMENAIYSVISPEGCAAILWRDASKAEQAANALKISAFDLKEFGIIHEIIQEPGGGAHKDFNAAADKLKKSIKNSLNKLVKVPIDELLDQRYNMLRKFGVFKEK